MKEEEVNQAAEEGKEKVNRLKQNIPKILREIWGDIRIMIAMLRDYVKGRYTEVPWYIITSVAGAIAYFAAPVDVIPDLVPGLGYLDDALVVAGCLDVARADLRKYEKWREPEKGPGDKDENPESKDEA